MLIKILLLSAGGALGALFRYGLGGMVYKVAGTHFPFGTLVVNIIGCLLIGFFGVLHQEKFILGPNLKLFLMIGVLGAFTTFSTFGYETWELMKASEWLKAGLNVFLSVSLSFIGLWIGVTIGRII
jgi:CrcB protein